MATGDKATIEKTMQMGLGEALERLLRLHNVLPADTSRRKSKPTSRRRR